MIVLPHPVDLWTWVPLYTPFLRAVTTNGTVKSDGSLVMGRGTALQAVERHPDLSKRLGALVQQEGNRLHVLPDIRLVTFPTKNHWRDPSDMALIQRSAEQLRDMLKSPECPWQAVVLPRPGCGYGDLTWEQVAPALAPVLKDLPVYVIHGGK